MRQAFDFYYDGDVRRFKADILERDENGKYIVSKTIDIGDSRHMAIFHAKKILAEHMMDIDMIRKEK